MNLINQLLQNWYRLEWWEQKVLVGATLGMGLVLILLISKCHGDVAILNG